LTGLESLEVFLACIIITVLIYGCIADSSEPLTLSDLKALRRSTASLREKEQNLQNMITRLNEDRVKAYQACVWQGTRQQALQTARVDHEELPAYIMDEYSKRK